MRSGDSRSSGYVDWSLSAFQIINLIDGDAFPGFSAHQLQLYDQNGDIIVDSENNDYLYLPFINLTCVLETLPMLNDTGMFASVPDPRYVLCVVLNGGVKSGWL